MKTFGSDPEMMLVKGDKYYSAIGIVRGDSDNRVNFSGHQFYYDNVLAECAIKPGASKKEVINNFRECFKIYADMVNPYKLKPQASYSYDRDQLVHPDAQKVGCSKDFCAQLIRQMTPPIEAIKTNTLRSGGGHIHLGADILKKEGPDPILTVHMLDLFAAIPSLWLDRDPTSLIRRELYGQASRYRVKPYGIEYRSLSNFWLATQKLTGLIYDLSMFCIEFVENQQAWKLWEYDHQKFLECDEDELACAWKCTGYDVNEIFVCINTGKKDLSHLEFVKKLLPTGLKKDLEKMIARPEDLNFYKAWDLN